MTTTQQTEKTILVNYDTIIDAITGALKETQGRCHVISLHDIEDVQEATWDVLTRAEKFELEHGVDYIEVEDIADFDCCDDIYSENWESRIDIHTEIEIGFDGPRLEVMLLNEYGWD